MTGRPRLTKSGALAIVIAVLMLTAGLMKTINLLILLGDLLFVLIILNAFLARRIAHGVELVRIEDPDHVAGQPTSRTIHVRTTSGRDALVSIREQCVAFQARGSVRLLANSSDSVRLPFTPPQRGVFSLSTFVGSGYPFGFVRFERPTQHTLSVGPRLGTLDLDEFRRWLRRHGSAEVRQRRSRQTLGAHAELRGVRPFRSGDSPRHVHWRTSARRGELLVREFDTPDAQDLVIILDVLGPEIEDAVSLAATIVTAWCHGDQSPRLSLIVPGHAEPLSGRASLRLARQMLRAMAELTGREPWRCTEIPAAYSRHVRLLVTNHEPAAGRAITSGSQRLSPDTAPAWYHAPN